MPESLVEDLEKKRLKNLKKYILDNRFILDDDIVSINENLKTTISQAIVDKFSNIQVYDIISYLKDNGGSGGLTRYWALVKNESSQFDIIELKQRATPATIFSTISQSPLELKNLANNIWGELPVYFEELEIEGNNFQVRSRTKEDINLNKVEKNEREVILKIQVAFIARHHKLYEIKASIFDSKWFIENSKLVAKRYLRAFEEFKNK